MTIARLSAPLVVALAFLLAARPVSAAEWRIDPAKSWLGFKGTMAGVAFEGRFKRWDARISFDPAEPEHGHAVVTVDMSSAETGDRQKDEALPQSDWFDAKSFPNASFKVQSFRSGGGTSFDAIGTLTIRNVTKAVVLPMTIEVSGTTLHASGHLDVVRTDYGVGQGSWTSAQWVALDVVASFDVTAERLK
jgi:polyisoprenoid-binding protein YceI